MKDFLLIALGASIFFRLISMFTREGEPRGKSVPVGSDGVAKIGRGKYRRVESVAVGFAAPHGWRFNLRRERVFDRFAKLVGLAREFQTNDSAFDSRIYIESDDDALHAQLAGRRELRNQILAYFADESIKRLTCATGRFWFTLKGTGWDKELSNDEIGRRAAAPLMSGVLVLRDQMAKPLVSDDPARDPTRVTRRHFTIALVTLVVIAILGLLWQWFHQDHQVVVDNVTRISAAVTVGIAISALLVMVATLGGTAHAQRVLLDILLAGIPATWFAVFGSAMFLNEALDGSSARRVPVVVERSWTWKGSKGQPHYQAQLRWPDSRATPEVDLKRGEYAILDGATCIDVLWHAGRFGDGWIERYQAHNEGDCNEGVE